MKTSRIFIANKLLQNFNRVTVYLSSSVSASLYSFLSSRANHVIMSTVCYMFPCRENMSKDIILQIARACLLHLESGGQDWTRWRPSCSVPNPYVILIKSVLRLMTEYISPTSSLSSLCRQNSSWGSVPEDGGCNAMMAWSACELIIERDILSPTYHSLHFPKLLPLQEKNKNKPRYPLRCVSSIIVVFAVALITTTITTASTIGLVGYTSPILFF